MPRPPRIIDKVEFTIGTIGILSIIINTFSSPIVGGWEDYLVHLSIYIFGCFFFTYLIMKNIRVFNLTERNNKDTQGGNKNE